MTHPLFSLIIPTFNEAENIVEVLPRAEARLTGIAYEIIVVDDESPDGTARQVEAYRQSHPAVRLIQRRGRRGLSPAVVEGLDAAQGEILGVMDADLSHDERILPRLIQAVRNGAELAVGSRRIAGGGADRWPWYRRLTSSVATRLSIWLLNLPLSDPMSGYFVLRRSLYESCRPRLAPQGYKIFLEIFCKASPARWEEVPFVFRDRRQGYSKLSWRVMGHLLRSLMHLRGHRRWP